MRSLTTTAAATVQRKIPHGTHRIELPPLTIASTSAKTTLNPSILKLLMLALHLPFVSLLPHWISRRDKDLRFAGPNPAYNEADTVTSQAASLHSSSDDADTVISIAPPLKRTYSRPSPSPRVLILLLVALLALWLTRLGSAPLFDVDEGAFAEATRELVNSKDWGSTTLNGADRFDKPILVYWLQAVSLKIFGVTEFAVRLPSALCGYLWCVALAVFAWRRYGAPVAISAACILATSLGPMLIGRAATADALLNLLLTLSTLDLWRHLEQGQDAPRRRAFAWIGLGLLAKGPIALLIPAATAGLWLMCHRDRSRLLRLVCDCKAWFLLIAIAAPWYAYAIWRHGWAFVDGFLLHHNLDRFSGSLEGHRGSLGYYLWILPLAMMPWTPLLWPIARGLRARWKEPLGRFLQLWLAFVLVFFSFAGTKLPHYVLYGFTPLTLLAAQQLTTMRPGVRIALCATALVCVIIGAASPWIASLAAQHSPDELARILLSSAPSAPWVWLGLPVAGLVFALAIWLPNVRSYLSEAEGTLGAALLTCAWLVMAVIPWWGQTLQDPVRSLAHTLPIAQLNLLDTQPLVQWQLHQPSIGYYLGRPVPRRNPSGREWALTRIDRLTPHDLQYFEIVQEERGYALVRPATAASEPLSQLGAALAAQQAHAVTRNEKSKSTAPHHSSHPAPAPQHAPTSHPSRPGGGLRPN